MTRQTALCWLALAAGPLAAQERASDVTVEIHGTILMNGWRNSGATNNSDVPTIAVRAAPGSGRQSSLGGAIRQTRLTGTIRSESVLGGRLFGELDVDFFGGQQPSGGGRTHVLPRIRRAYGELQWPHATLLVGQEAPPIAEISPSSIGSIGFPLFASSGNLWLWVPQIRVTGWFMPPGGTRVGIEGAVLGPSTGDAQDPFLTQPDRGERSGRPAFEGRLVARWMAAGKPGTVSLGGHYGWFARADYALESSRAVVAAVSAPIGPWVEIRGEAFRGRALAGLGGGGIGQLTDASGLTPVRTKGGWAQLVAFPVRALELAAGAGIDDPDNRDLTAATGRLRNRTVAVSVTARPGPAVAGFELKRVTTTYAGPPVSRATNTHLNLGLGFSF